jgi:hypothetical protein
MLRLFSMFPPGLAGIALVGLRIAVATLILMDVLPVAGLMTLGWETAGLIVTMVFFTLGVLTPYICLIFCVIEIVEMFFHSGVTDLHAGALFLITAALGLLGPGAYSVDARLFGRRRVVLPEGDEDDTA